MATIRKRGKRWQAQIRLADHPPMSKSFGTKRAAESWARNAEYQLINGQDERRPTVTTLRDILERYKDTVIALKISKSIETGIVDRFLQEDIANLHLHNVTREAACAYRDLRLAKVKASTLVREIGILRHCWDVASNEWGVAPEPNPFSKMRMPRIGGRRERRLRAGEFDLIVDAARQQRNNYVLPTIIFALETALRGKEILALEWSDFDSENGTVRVRNSKNGHSRVVPLTPQAMRVIMDLPTDLSASVFPITDSTLKQAWRRMMRKTHIVDLHFHDLRHEAISRFIEAGLTIPEVSQISGHRDSRSLLRYAHPTPEQIRRKFEAMEGLPPVEMSSAVACEETPPLFSLMIETRQHNHPNGQNWQPDDFGSEDEYLHKIDNQRIQDALPPLSDRWKRAILLQRQLGLAPKEAIEKINDINILRKS